MNLDILSYCFYYIKVSIKHHLNSVLVSVTLKYVPAESLDYLVLNKPDLIKEMCYGVE